MVTKPNVVIVSPNYPNKYESNSHCEITIRYPERVRVTFLDFSIINEPPCGNVYMTLFDGSPSSTTQIVSKLCGTRRPPPLYAKGNVMHLLFHSDHDASGYGFKILAESGKAINMSLKC